MRIIRIKNVQETADIYCGQTIEPNELFTIKDGDEGRWAANEKVNEHLWAGKIVVNDGDVDITDKVRADKWLKGNLPITLDAPKSLDDKPFIATTPRPIGTFTYVSSRGDDNSDQTKVDSGAFIEYVHTNGQGVAVHDPIYFDINAVVNETHIHTGRVDWKGAIRDRLSIQIVPQVTPVSDGSNTMFNVVGGVVIAAAGNGTKVVDLATAKLVQMTPNEFGVTPPGYWDATFNTSTKQFENISFNAVGKGKYNIFATELVLNAFIPCFLMLGDGWYELDSHDVTQLGHNTRIKFIPETRGTDHDWQMCVAIQLYRKKTV